jgi:hypothetical protein
VTGGQDRSPRGYDGLQIAEARLLGVSASERVSKWKYDLRSRLQASLAASSKRDAEPESEETRGRAKEQLSPADFREGQERTPQLDAATRAAMQARGVDPSKVDPPSMTLSERAGGGHKIDTVTKGPQARTFGYAGAEVVDDDVPGSDCARSDSHSRSTTDLGLLRDVYGPPLLRSGPRRNSMCRGRLP